MVKIGENVLFFIDKVVDFMVFSQVFCEYLNKMLLCDYVFFEVLLESVFIYLQCLEYYWWLY